MKNKKKIMPDINQIAVIRKIENNKPTEFFDNSELINELEMENELLNNIEIIKDNFEDEIKLAINSQPNKIDAKNIEKFMFAGNAIITIRNKESGNRFTYKITKLKDNLKNIWFISLLTGADNQNNYTFFGTVFEDDYQTKFYKYSSKSKIGIATMSIAAFKWFFNHRNNLPEKIEVWHNGYCAKCGKLLTVPESIKSGYGPKCAELI